MMKPTKPTKASQPCSLEIDIQRVCETIEAPSDERLKNIITLALSFEKSLEKSDKNIPIALTLRLTDPEEMQTLNREFRGKDKPTNVLSFPFEMPESITLPEWVLGDIAICPEIVMSEAIEQKKSYDDHFAHMVIHGILHLLGYDHEQDDEAVIMEALEIKILEKMGIHNPYQELD